MACTWGLMPRMCFARDVLRYVMGFGVIRFMLYTSNLYLGWRSVFETRWICFNIEVYFCWGMVGHVCVCVCLELSCICDLTMYYFQNKMVPARCFLVRVARCFLVRVDDRAFLVGKDMLCFFQTMETPMASLVLPLPKRPSASSWWIFGRAHHLLNTSRFCWLYQVVSILSLYTMYYIKHHETI